MQKIFLVNAYSIYNKEIKKKQNNPKDRNTVESDNWEANYKAMLERNREKQEK